MALGSIQPLAVEDQESSWEGTRAAWTVRLTNSPSSVSQLSRTSGSLDVSQPYWSLRPVTATALTLHYFT
jgi:hypothetical protein